MLWDAVERGIMRKTVKVTKNYKFSLNINSL